MRKFIISVICAVMALPVFAVGENVPTSKSYVDTAIAQKQDTIPANIGAVQVLTNTGTPGDVGTKNIYDSSAAYAGQTDALVTAGTMNAAVQNAIESEFVCISWVDDDPSKECLLLEIRQAQNLLNPANIHQGTIGSGTGKVVPSYTTRCYFDFIPVHAGDIVHFSSAADSPPPYPILYLYSHPTENDYTGYIYHTQSPTNDDRQIFSFPIQSDGYIRGIWMDKNRDFTPADIIAPMVEISSTPHGYVPYKTLIPSSN